MDSQAELKNVRMKLDNTQVELDSMKRTKTWKVHERITGVSLIRNFYLWLLGKVKH